LAQGPAFCMPPAMQHRSLIALACFAFGLAGCAQSDGINQDGAVYEGIVPDAEISLIGTEPFWGIDIAPGPKSSGYLAVYASPENVDGQSFTLVRFAGNNGLGFSGELDGRPVQIAITPGDCSDAMSDRTYPYTATVKLGDITLRGCGYSGDVPFTGPEEP